jgi:hypothetical protein
VIFSWRDIYYLVKDAVGFELSLAYRSVGVSGDSDSRFLECSTYSDVMGIRDLSFASYFASRRFRRS